MKKAEYNKATLKLLQRNLRDLTSAEKTILHAMAIEYQEGLETIPFITQKLFEIAETILLVEEQIVKCKKEIKKS
jgi:hypothetical protein|tara:strand:+ start:2902 stop:3126 length:225 start_codon:yes stop_codon:yes gene_type:complete